MIDVSKDERRYAIEHLSKQPLHDHADKQHHGELGFALFAPTPQRALNTTEKTKVYVASMNTGFKNDQTTPDLRASLCSGPPLRAWSLAR